MSIDDEQNEAEARRKKGDSGEGDSDSFGRGKAGAGAGSVRLPPNKLKQVTADWRHFDVKDVVAALAEFFADLPMRASANLSVAWENTKEKSFAIVTWLVDLSKRSEFNPELNRERAAGSDSRGLQKQKPKNPAQRSNNPNMNLGPSGPTGTQ